MPFAFPARAVSSLVLSLCCSTAGAEDITAGQYRCDDGVVLPSVFIPAEGGGPKLYVLYYDGPQPPLYSFGDWRDAAEVYWQFPEFSGYVWHQGQTSSLRRFDHLTGLEQILHQGCRFEFVDG